MHISWLGGTAIKLQVKPGNEEVNIVIDPYRPAAGQFPRSLAPQIALFTRGEADIIALSGNPFKLSTPGECETKGVLITAVYGNDASHILVRLDAEGLSLAHLGLMNTQLTESQIEAVADVDILFLPIGAKGAYDTDAAVNIVNAIEPKIIIPMAFASDNDPDAARPDALLRALGAKTDANETKVIIKKKDLPQEETKVILLKKE